MTERRALLLGLIGARIQPSRTPALHEREADAHGIRCLYQLLDLNAMPGGERVLASLIDSAEHVRSRPFGLPRIAQLVAELNRSRLP